MPTARASRKIAASPEALWTIVRDPYHLPRWWPRVTRVEDVDEGTFTEVMKTKAGKSVRADFDLVRTRRADLHRGLGAASGGHPLRGRARCLGDRGTRGRRPTRALPPAWRVRVRP